VATVLVALREHINNRGEWAGLLGCLSYCAVVASMTELSRALVEIERLVQRHAEDPRQASVMEPLWKTLLWSGSEEAAFQNEQECQEMFDFLMAAVRALAAPARSYSESMGTGKGAVFFRAARMTDPLSSRIFGVFQVPRTFFDGSGVWYGFAEGGVQVGDRLALLFPDAYVPFILRPNGTGFEMVGLARLPERLRQIAIASGAGHLKEFTII
jgi:hypothetical protein